MPVRHDRPPWRIVFRRGRDRRLWNLVEAQRLALVERLEGLTSEQWDRPSRCEGWRTRDVLGHLVHMAESDGGSLELERTGGFAESGRQFGELGGPELCRRLRHAAASHYSGMPTVALTEVVVHGDDMLQPLGQRMELDPEVAVRVLRLSRMVDLLAPGFAFNGRRHRRVRLAATDVAWASGHGPIVEGSALDLIALLSNRGTAIDSLSGPGVARLKQSRPRSPSARWVK